MAIKIRVRFQMPEEATADRYGIAVALTQAAVITKANTQTFATLQTGATAEEIITSDIFELNDGTDLVDKTLYYIIISASNPDCNWRTDFSAADVVSTLSEWQYQPPVLETETQGQTWERICRDSPVEFDQYFGMNMTQSSAEVLVHDCEAGEYLGIYGNNTVVYPISEYDVEADVIFGEDSLKKYGPGTTIKMIWEPTQESQLFGRFDIQNLDEIIMYGHITSTRCTLGRDIRQGDWIMTPHNQVIYEVVMVKNTNYLFHLGQFYTTLTCLPRMVSQERGVGVTDSDAPEPTSGYFHTEGDKDLVDAYVQTIAITGEAETNRKIIFGNW